MDRQYFGAQKPSLVMASMGHNLLAFPFWRFLLSHLEQKRIHLFLSKSRKRAHMLALDGRHVVISLGNGWLRIAMIGVMDHPRCESNFSAFEIRAKYIELLFRLTRVAGKVLPEIFWHIKLTHIRATY